MGKYQPNALKLPVHRYDIGSQLEKCLIFHNKPFCCEQEEDVLQHKHHFSFRLQNCKEHIFRCAFVAAIVNMCSQQIIIPISFQWDQLLDEFGITVHYTFILLETF